LKTGLAALVVKWHARIAHSKKGIVKGNSKYMALEASRKKNVGLRGWL